MRPTARLNSSHPDRSAGAPASGGKFKGIGSVEYEYEGFEQDRLIQHLGPMPFGIAQHRFEFTPEGESTRLTQSMAVEPNALSRVLWPLMMVKQLRELKARLKGYVESQS